MATLVDGQAARKGKIMTEKTEEQSKWSDHIRVAETILNQMGGRAFLEAVGRPKIVAQTNGVVLFFNRETNDQPNVFEVVLDPTDVYDVRVGRMNPLGDPVPGVILKHIPEVYCDQLISVFESEMGMQTGVTVEWTCGPSPAG